LQDAVFETLIPKEFFAEMERTRNSTYFVVKAVKTGKTTLKSTFTTVRNLVWKSE
jgi:hypothetical protein